MSVLRERMLQDLQIRNYARATCRAYIDAVAAFSQYFKRPPDQLSPEDVRTYQIYLVKKRKISPSYLKIAVSALRFFYRVTLGRDFPLRYIPYPRKENRLPVVLSRLEVAQLLAAVRNPKQRMILATIYATGLRVGESVRLRVRDIDKERMMVRVRQGKGHKDRYIPLSPVLLEQLREYWKIYRPRTWLFPGARPDRPMTKGTVGEVCRNACKRAGLAKIVSPHALRHSFATHLLEAGVNVRVIQELLGHGSLKTTTVYTHIAPSALGNFRSPVDDLPPVD